MCGHVVRSFVGMFVGTIFRSDAAEVGLEVAAHAGVCIFLDEERCRGVAAEDGEQAGLHLLISQPCFYVRCEFVEALASGCDFEFVYGLLQSTAPDFKDISVAGCAGSGGK